MVYLRYYTEILLEQLSTSTAVTMLYVTADTEPWHLLNRTMGVFQNRSTGFGIEKNLLYLQGIKAYFFDCLARNQSVNRAEPS
jgi:hypothetical protein